MNANSVSHGDTDRMFVWVTGTHGFIGSRLARALEARGARVARVTNRAPSDDTVTMNFADCESIRGAIAAHGRPEVLYHLGWGSMENAEAAAHIEENVWNSTRLIDELYRCGTTKIVFAGSINEYGSREGELCEPHEPTGRLTKYAQGKRSVAVFGHEHARVYGRTFLHVRLANVLGVGTGKSSLINSLFNAYIAGTEISLTACDQFRDYVYVADAVEGLMRIGALDMSNTVNLGSGRNVQLRRVVELIWSGLGGDPARLLFGARQRPSNEPDQQPCYVSVAKLRQLTGWQPPTPIEEGVARTVESLCANARRADAEKDR